MVGHPKNRKKIVVMVGTRPNFIKVTQFRRVAASYPRFDLSIIHTGQHYDARMTEVFFDQFGMRPDVMLSCEQGDPATQMASILKESADYLRRAQPDLVMVPGDVNSTLAVALAANKLGICLAHIESGLRSFDRAMPEEFNRILTDELSDICFVTEQSGIENLKKAGVSDERIHFVGNTMIDTLVAFRNDIGASAIPFNIPANKPYILVTMHRPSNVDSRDGLMKLIQVLRHLADNYTIVFPIHPRTKRAIAASGLDEEWKIIRNMIVTEPLDYFCFQKLISRAAFVLTDSGGVQEETTFLRVPCLTLRENTERPVTVTTGTNTLLDFDTDLIMKYADEMRSGHYKKGDIPPLWDGRSTERIFEKLEALL